MSELYSWPWWRAQLALLPVSLRNRVWLEAPLGVTRPSLSGSALALARVDRALQQEWRERAVSGERLAIIEETEPLSAEASSPSSTLLSSPLMLVHAVTALPSLDLLNELPASIPVPTGTAARMRVDSYLDELRNLEHHRVRPISHSGSAPGSSSLSSSSSRVHASWLMPCAAVRVGAHWWLLSVLPHSPRSLDDIVLHPHAHPRAPLSFLLYQLTRLRTELAEHALTWPLSLAHVLVSDSYWLRVPASLPLAPASFPDVHALRLEEAQRAWCRGSLSNLDYLLVLNAWAGRVSGDPHRHPIVPWVIDFRTPTSYRDLTRTKYRLTKGDEQLDMQYAVSGYHVPESLSELTLRIYAARCTERAQLLTSVRSHFHAHEYPASLERLYQWSPDECVPEFFVSEPHALGPSLFRSAHADLPDLALPEWATDVGDFVRQHRAALESAAVSSQLHHWIDLTWGYLLTGRPALLAKNVPCQALSDAVPYRFVQLFTTPHPPRFHDANAHGAVRTVSPPPRVALKPLRLNDSQLSISHKAATSDILPAALGRLLVSAAKQLDRFSGDSREKSFEDPDTYLALPWGAIDEPPLHSESLNSSGPVLPVSTRTEDDENMSRERVEKDAEADELAEFNEIAFQSEESDDDSFGLSEEVSDQPLLPSANETSGDGPGWIHSLLSQEPEFTLPCSDDLSSLDSWQAGFRALMTSAPSNLSIERLHFLDSPTSFPPHFEEMYLILSGIESARNSLEKAQLLRRELEHRDIVLLAALFPHLWPHLRTTLTSEDIRAPRLLLEVLPRLVSLLNSPRSKEEFASLYPELCERMLKLLEDKNLSDTSRQELYIILESLFSHATYKVLENSFGLERFLSSYLPIALDGLRLNWKKGSFLASTALLDWCRGLSPFVVSSQVVSQLLAHISKPRIHAEVTVQTFLDLCSIVGVGFVDEHFLKPLLSSISSLSKRISPTSSEFNSLVLEHLAICLKLLNALFSTAPASRQALALVSNSNLLKDAVFFAEQPDLSKLWARFILTWSKVLGPSRSRTALANTIRSLLDTSHKLDVEVSRILSQALTSGPASSNFSLASHPSSETKSYTLDDISDSTPVHPEISLAKSDDAGMHHIELLTSNWLSSIPTGKSMDDTWFKSQFLGRSYLREHALDHLSIQPSERLIAAVVNGSKTHNVKLLNVADLAGHPLKVFEGHEKTILASCWLGNGLHASADSRSVLIWDVETATPIFSHSIAGDSYYSCLSRAATSEAFPSLSQELLVTATGEGDIEILDPRVGAHSSLRWRASAASTSSEKLTHLACNQLEYTMCLGYDNGFIREFDFRFGKLLNRWSIFRGSDSGSLVQLTYLSSQVLLTSGCRSSSSESALHLWTLLEHPQLVHSFHGHRGKTNFTTTANTLVFSSSAGLSLVRSFDPKEVPGPDSLLTPRKLIPGSSPIKLGSLTSLAILPCHQVLLVADDLGHIIVSCF